MSWSVLTGQMRIERDRWTGGKGPTSRPESRASVSYMERKGIERCGFRIPTASSRRTVGKNQTRFHGGVDGGGHVDPHVNRTTWGNSTCPSEGGGRSNGNVLHGYSHFSKRSMESNLMKWSRAPWSPTRTASVLIEAPMAGSPDVSAGFPYECPGAVQIFESKHGHVAKLALVRHQK